MKRTGFQALLCIYEGILTPLPNPMKQKCRLFKRTHFETGTRKPSFDNLRNLADALDVTTDYLLGRVSEFKDLAGADRLHRHYEALDGSDRKMADDLITMLAKRAEDKGKK